MKEFTKFSAKESARIELHDNLKLTGAEISINDLPAGASVPFVHAHRQNEEIYCVLKGSGKAVIDDETVLLQEGDWLRVSPSAKRRFFASDESEFKYICIQVRENSLQEYTAEDAIVF